MLIVNKNNVSPFTVSILNKTNRIVSSSQENFAGIRPGSYIKLGNNEILYQISEINRFFYNKKFETIDNRTIKINDNIGINLQKEDVLEVIYDEYELNSVINIENPGRFYIKDEIITIKGGEPSINIYDGIPYPTKLKIEEIDENGSIKLLGPSQNGKYIIPPKGKTEVVSQHGNGAILELNYKIIDTSALVSRVIKDIKIDESKNETIINLDYSLPLGIKNGKISIKKYEILLSSIYLGQTIYNANFSIFKDFTPNYNFLLLLKNSANIADVFNKNMLDIDRKFKELEDRVNNI